MLRLVGLYAAATALGVVKVVIGTGMPSVSLFSVLIVVAGLFLRPKAAAIFYGYLLAWLTVVAVQVFAPPTSLIAVAGQVIVMGIMVWVSQSRERLGVTGVEAETMFAQLKDKLTEGGTLPSLPHGWHAESCLQSANGSTFSGDFLVTNLSRDGKLLEIALVDVSGKGLRAGTRALLLSGAFGGLLGSVRPEEFLVAANSYVLRQGWREGFATCVHVAVDLVTGTFDLGNAGHPPPAQYLAGSGRWQILDDERDPLLGVLDGAAYHRFHGQLSRGDALLLYTDGVVETRRLDLHDGIDRMLGTAERVATSGFHGMSTAVVQAARSGDGDDRAAVVLAWT